MTTKTINKSRGRKAMDPELASLFIQLSWRKRWQMGPRWMNKWPFSDLKKVNKKAWDTLVAADKKYPDPRMPSIKRSKVHDF
jgi:hypothetical protein